MTRNDYDELFRKGQLTSAATSRWIIKIIKMK